MRRPVWHYRALAVAVTALAPAVLFIHLEAAAQSPPIAEPARLTLRTALDLALSSNAELAVAQRELEASEGAVQQGGARPNPELGLLLEDTRKSTRTTTIQLDQPIELGGKRAARIGAAERARDIAAAELAAKRAELRATVVSAFNEVLLGQERIGLAGESLELARRASEVAGKRVQAGKVSPVEETRAKVAEATVRLEAAQAQSELRAARQRLAATWGSTAPRFERAQADTGGARELPPLPSREAIEARLARSPNLRRVELEVQRRRALTDIERARRVPDVTVSVGVQRNAELGLTQAVVGVAVPLPIFDRNRGNLLEALRREDKAQAELTAARIALASEAMQARERLDATRTEAQTLERDVLPGAQSAYDVATKGFELGRFDFLDVLDAQRTLFQARSQYLRSLTEANRAAADIDRLLGDLADAAPLTVPRSSPQ